MPSSWSEWLKARAGSMSALPPMPQPKQNRIGDKGKRGRTLVLIDARRLLARAVFRAAVRRGGNND